MCAGPGRENACRDRAGAHKVLSKLFALHLILFGLNHFVSSSILPGLEAQRVLIEDIITFLEAVCAGPGRKNACRDRAGAHKVLSKFVRFASILSSFGLTQFVLFRSCKVFY